MTIGFRSEIDFTPIIGWELYQVTLDKNIVEFWFNNGWSLLNVADCFAFRSKDGSNSYTYEVQGRSKAINLDSILRRKIVDAKPRDLRWLDMTFDNGDTLSIHDHPEFRSWWFLGGGSSNQAWQVNWAYGIEDTDSELFDPATYAANWPTPTQ